VVFSRQKGLSVQRFGSIAEYSIRRALPASVLLQPSYEGAKLIRQQRRREHVSIDGGSSLLPYSAWIFP
jgi:hypothetical protein